MATTTPANASTAYKKEIVTIANSGAHVRDYGAVGDGTTNDTAAIDLAITAAGTNGTIIFDGSKTYLTYGGHVFLSGQKVKGNGATLKRINQISDVYLGADVTSTPVTAITVTDGSKFTVGQIVGLTNNDGAGDGYSTGYYAGTPTVNYSTSASRIASILGNVLTLETGLVERFSTGPALSNAGSTYCVTCGPVVYVGFDSLLAKLAWASLPTNVHLDGLVVDGNRANQTKGNWWDVSHEFIIGCHQFQMTDCHVVNGMSDAFIFSGNQPRISNCTAEDIEGNGFHPGAWEVGKGVNGGKVTNCTVVNCNLDPTIGHADGAFMFSNDVTGFIYADCVCDTTTRSGFGGLNSTDSNIVLANCYIKDAAFGAFSVSNVETMTISGNVFINCGGNTVTAVIMTAEIAGCTGVAVTGNTFIDSNVYCRGTNAGVTISGNSFVDSRTYASPWLISSVALQDQKGTTVQGNSFKFTHAVPLEGVTITISGSTANNLNITGNTFISPNTGVKADSNSVFGLSITNNIIVNPINYGMLIQQKNAWGACVIASNIILFDDATNISTNAYGIRTTGFSGAEPIQLSNNNVVNGLPSNTQHCMYLNNGNVMVQGNRLVRGANTNAKTITIAGTDATTYVLNNSWDVAPTTFTNTVLGDATLIAKMNADAGITDTDYVADTNKVI